MAVSIPTTNTAIPPGEAATNGAMNGNTNGHATANGLSNGLVNGHTNGLTNGHSNPLPSAIPTLEDSLGNGYTSGYTHGYTNGYTTGYQSGFAKQLTSGDSTGVLPAAGEKKLMPLAIVGMSCRLPGNVATPAEFWELCSRARSGYTEVPDFRFNNKSFYHPVQGRPGCQNAKGGNFLQSDLQAFDAPFFSLTAQEATSMDPQQRLLLECTFEALESAGIPKHSIVGKDVGVFVGGSFSEYEAHLHSDPETIPMYQATGMFCSFFLGFFFASCLNPLFGYFFPLRRKNISTIFATAVRGAGVYRRISFPTRWKQRKGTRVSRF